jgi:hypothetical protein
MPSILFTFCAVIDLSALDILHTSMDKIYSKLGNFGKLSLDKLGLVCCYAPLIVHDICKNCKKINFSGSRMVVKLPTSQIAYSKHVFSLNCYPT